MGLAFVLTIAGGLIVAGVVAVFQRWLSNKPQRDKDAERARAMQDAILGSGEVKDLGGGVIAKAEPGLVQRTSVLEETVAKVVDLLAHQVQDRERITGLERGQTILGVRVTSLERNQDERVAIRQESASLLDAVAKRDSDVIDVQDMP